MTPAYETGPGSDRARQVPAPFQPQPGTPGSTGDAAASSAASCCSAAHQAACCTTLQKPVCCTGDEPGKCGCR